MQPISALGCFAKDMHQPIPVTIITGFLGAGKTTLLNHLIQQNPERRLAIIENEFGDIAIDNDLIISADDGIFEMSNGCICCSLNAELTEILLRLIESDKPFDHLLIETTGIAEPDGVAVAFVTDPAMQEYFRLDAVVCLADAGNIEDMLAEREEARKQVTFADLIIINKQSEVHPNYLQQLQEKLAAMNPFATIHTADYAHVDTNILHLNAYDNREVTRQITHISEHHHHHHHHTDDVVAHSFIFDQPFDFLRFMHWARVLLLVQGKQIYRIKGILHFQTDTQRVIFQSVRTQSAFQRGEAWHADETPQSRIVFIGKGIQRAALERSLRSCLAK